MAFELTSHQFESMAGDMQLNRLCGCGTLKAAEAHIPADGDPDFLRGMATGLMLAASLLGDDDKEMSDMYRCFAAQAASVSLQPVRRDVD